MTLPTLTRFRDLEEFDGPILTELRAPNGDVYLEKWATRAGMVDTVLAVRSSVDLIEEYMEGNISMLRLLISCGDDGYLVDYEGGQRLKASPVKISEIPIVFLPTEDAMHDRSLRPSE